MKGFYVYLFLSIVCALADDCNVVPMTRWASESIHRTEALAQPVPIVIVQHTVTPEEFTDDKCERIVQSIRHYQMTVDKFEDIGMSFLICGNGQVYEGTGWTLAGAHTKNYNNKSIALSFIGEFTSSLPSKDALKAAEDLLACGVKNGHLSDDYKLVGHRQLAPTMSPGNALQEEISTWPHWTQTA